MADTERTGSIGGGSAVQFFNRSKLPVDVLKSIWTVADSPPTNSLDHRKFAVAVRLIQLAQNGQKGQGANLAGPTGIQLRPVFFEGVSGVSVPLPQQQPAPPQQTQQEQQQPSTPQPPTSSNPPMQQQHSAPPLSPSMRSVQGSIAPPQRTHQPPSTPPHGPPHAPYSMSGGGILTVQDPYTLTPGEQSRYEQLFGEYSKEDGYCYGEQAVALFGKSGMPSTQLAAIWNMVDYGPVDNRLDKLEFALAMHLIVCVSKKHLPLPASLPISLKQLKAQQQAVTQTSNIEISSQVSQPPALVQQQSQQSFQNGGGSAPPPLAGTNISMMGTSGLAGSIGMAGLQNPPPENVSMMGAGGLEGGMGLSGLPGPPPLEPPGGGHSISDAFEGLVTGGSGETVSTYTAPSPSIQPAIQPSISMESSNQMKGIDVPKPSSMYDTHVPTPETFAVQSNVQSTPKRKQNHAGGSSLDLDELREALQKLQAENISLKARLGTISEEEEDVRKELTKTVSDIMKLSSELTTLRAEVLAAKSRLLEVTGELAAAKEKKR